ncbi:tigger transposable element-derived protein 1-like [Parasteatoda tepidariorum]|uniref:tigger transposable element-derived protein 1-like n=1 Tax=Parasteatoda tepidariorum TaxID=114398 RepID=UPI0039BCB1A7
MTKRTRHAVCGHPAVITEIFEHERDVILRSAVRDTVDRNAPVPTASVRTPKPEFRSTAYPLRRAWVKQYPFKEWLFEVCPIIKDYLDANDLPLKALLLLDNAPGHPKDLKDNFLTDFLWLTVQFSPPNTTSLIQPMDQEVIAAFKKLYTRALFCRCFEASQFSSTMTSKKFWKEKFDILEAIRIIQKAWSEVTQRQLISAWRKLCPSFVQGDGGDQGDTPEIMDEILTTARDLELEVNEDDIEELIMGHVD